MTAKSHLPQGPLDLLILKVVALGPVHGYAWRNACSRCRAMWSGFLLAVVRHLRRFSPNTVRFVGQTIAFCGLPPCG